MGQGVHLSGGISKTKSFRLCETNQLVTSGVALTLIVRTGSPVQTCEASWFMYTMLQAVLLFCCQPISPSCSLHPPPQHTDARSRACMGDDVCACMYALLYLIQLYSIPSLLHKNVICRHVEFPLCTQNTMLTAMNVATLKLQEKENRMAVTNHGVLLQWNSSVESCINLAVG